VPAAFAADASAPEVLTAGQRAVEQHFAPLFARCQRKDGAACGRLAERLQFATDYREINRLLAALAGACTAGVMEGCAGQGAALVRGINGTVDGTRGTELLRRACSDKSAFACAYLAEALKEQGVPRNKEEGLRIARDACKTLGSWPCMTEAGRVFKAGKVREAVKLVSRACDTGDPIACYELGLQYADGAPGVGQDRARATVLFGRACDHDLALSCFNLAGQFLRGTGAVKDERRGRELLQQACALGAASACDELARQNGNAQVYCELWGVESCYQVAKDLTKKNGETAAVAEAIVTAWTHACNRGDFRGCVTLEHLAGDYTEACDTGYNVRDACMFAGLIHTLNLDIPFPSGHVLAPDGARAGREFARACAAGAQPACAAMKTRR
jgi:TPR repeat protein